MKRHNKRKVVKTVALFLLVNMAFQLIAPLSAYALTSGPTTPEVQSFTPAGTSDMVDVFTGKFNYNIPLLELPGPNGSYPFNLAYTTDIAMDQEASWVGLGWNINAGAINRSVRGLPDDFDGSDKIVNKAHMKPNYTVGINGGVNLEFFGADFDKLGLNLGGSIFYNSYKGIGMSTDVGVSFSFSSEETEGSGAGMGVGLSLSQSSSDGATLKPSLSLTASDTENGDKTSTSLSAAIGYNTRRGLTDLSIGMSSSSSEAAKDANGKAIRDKGGKTTTVGMGGMGGSASISFANTAYTPSLTQEMKGENLSLSVKIGGAAFGLEGSFYVGGYFSNQEFKNQNSDVASPAYGYLYTDKSSNDVTAMLDFNREKDGMIRKTTPNLSIPNHTFDIYNISGQGAAGMFRAHRSHVVTLTDPDRQSLVGGGSLGIEYGIGEDEKIGVDGSVNISDTRAFELDGSMAGSHTRANNDPKNLNLPSDFEAVYFKINGENTIEPKSNYDYIGNDRAIDPASTLHNSTDVYKNKLYSPSNNHTRRPRNTDVEYFTFDEIRQQNGTSQSSNHNLGLPEFNVKSYSTSDIGNYYDLLSTNTSPSVYDDPSSGGLGKGNHIGGFKVLQPDGSNYVYGLPVYNIKQMEKSFSIEHDFKKDINLDATLSYASDGGSGDEDWYCHDQSSNQTLHRTNTSQYTTSHLLSSIQGPDYVDVDGNGPSDNDFGHWVKFNYVKVNDKTNPYKWRAPFEGINFNEGSFAKDKEDKVGMMMYGEKEVYYLATAETKTHIAVFEISERNDACGVTSMHQYKGQQYGLNGNSTANPSIPPAARTYKIDRIKLYSKKDYYTATGALNPSAQPLTTVHFAYTYELCNNIPNSNGSDQFSEDVSIANSLGSPNTPYLKGAPIPGTGKLTLRKLWFTYENSSRGKFNPYDFHYDNKNPDYDKFNQDRWGNYKEFNTGGATPSVDQQQFPYVKQFDPAISNFKTTVVDQWASAWHLSSVQTPSGSTIKVDYESDDYAYVQNRVAGQMFKIDQTGDFTAHNQLYDQSSNGGCKVYFKLQTPIPAGSTPAQQDAILAKYFEGLQTPDVDAATHKHIWQLYYKVKINMRTADEYPKDYISGYATFQPHDPTNASPNGWGIDPASSGTRAWIQLDPLSGGGSSGPFHPFAKAAWQYLQSTLPDISSRPGPVMAGADSQDPLSVMETLLSTFVQFKDLFIAFDDNARLQNWAKYIDLDNSCIRLSAPSKSKYGGGARVKRIAISDTWDQTFQGASQPTEYGVTYDYTTTDVDGNKISSGVATYEPILGGDEISLRYARNFTESIPLKTNNNLYFEYPINESYYPAASIGYSKVTVKSLVADKVLSNISGYSKVPSTGVTVNEFYTAKDFPVISEETPINIVQDPFFAIVPFIGQVKTDALTASQGYKVEINDMHGKPKKTSYYSISSTGVLNSQEVSWVQYDYRADEKTYFDGSKYYKLNNLVNGTSTDLKAMTGDAQYPNANSDLEMGVDYDYFTDVRYYDSQSGTGGLSFNDDDLILGPIIIPAFVPWPNISYSETQVTQQTSNKIIHKSGVMYKTTAYDGGSVVTTENKKYDVLTGKVLLTTVTNDFDKPIYKYNMPAHWYYDGMSAASQNWGFNFAPGFISKVADGTFEIPMSIGLDNLMEGDEFECVIKDAILGSFSINAKGIILKKISGGIIADINDLGYGLAVGVYTMPEAHITRSGHRNQITTDVGAITALTDPSIASGLFSPLCNIIQTLESGGANTAFFNFSTSPLNLSSWNVYVTKANANIYSPPTQIPCTTCPSPSIPLTQVVNSTLSQLATCNLNSTSNMWYSYNNNNSTVNNNLNSPDLTYFTSTFNPPSQAYGSALITVQSEVVDCYVYVNGTYLGVTTPANSFSPSTVLTINLFNPPNQNLIQIGSANTITLVTIARSFIPGLAQHLGTPFVNCSIDMHAKVNGENRQSCNINSQAPILNDILSASATKYKDNWSLDMNMIRGSWTPPSTAPYDPYKIGEMGIYKPFESYVYVEDRKQNKETNLLTSASTNLYGANISQDGTFDNMPKFDWHNPDFWKCFDKWRLTNTITEYSPQGYELENKNILNQYSSALYSYEGKLSTAVAGNAQLHEIASEGFEEYMPVSPATSNISVDQTNVGTGNFSFLNNLNLNRTDYIKIPVLFAQGNVVMIDLPYLNYPNYNITPASFIKVEATGAENITPPLNCKFENIISQHTVVSSQSGILNGSIVGNTILTLDSKAPGFASCNDRCWTGNIYLPITRQLNSAFPAVSFTNEKAHTGKVSMKIYSTSTTPVISEFPQYDLKLIPGKQYVLSAWVSSTFTNLFPSNYLTQQMVNANWSISVGFGNSSSGISYDPLLNPNFRQEGEPIEGWRRLTALIKIPMGLGPNDLMYIKIPTFINNGVLPVPMYFDDIRIEPYDASLKTYVYDPADYKLRATLDDNNHAALYSYDAQGNLFLVKKETQRGIMTVQESRSNIKKRK